MVYLPTSKNQPNVGKCTIHGSYGFCHWLIFERCYEYKGQQKQFLSYLLVWKCDPTLESSKFHRRSLFRKKKRHFPQKLSIDYSSVVFFVYLVGGFNPSQNISQFGSFPQIGLTIKNIWNHHPVILDAWWVLCVCVRVCQRPRQSWQ